MKKMGRVLVALCVSSQLGYASMTETMVNMIHSPQLQNRRDAVKMAIGITNMQERERIVNSLCAALGEPQGDTSFEGSLHISIQVLGEMKLPSSIPCLLPYLTFVPEGYLVEELIPTEWYFPTARALVNIGQSSVKYMEEILNDSRSSDAEMKLAAWIISEVNGRKSALDILSRLKNAKRLSDGKLVHEYLREKKTTFANPRKLPEWKEGIMSPQKSMNESESTFSPDIVE